jgi:flagellar basal body-associated protein FliL
MSSETQYSHVEAPKQSLGQKVKALPRNTKIIIVALLIAVVIAVAYYFLVYKKEAAAADGSKPAADQSVK